MSERLTRPTSLWEYANPRRFMALSGALLPFVAVGTAVTLAIGLIWGFFFTPDDYRQGSTVKIIYIHVPSAMIAINCWLMMSIVWRCYTYSIRRFFFKHLFVI